MKIQIEIPQERADIVLAALWDKQKELEFAVRNIRLTQELTNDWQSSAVYLRKLYAAIRKQKDQKPSKRKKS